MKKSVIIATHHKTGTVWMATVFKAIAADLGATYVDYWAEKAQVEEALKRPFVLFNYDSDFRGHSQLLSRDDVRILHLIRDNPRIFECSPTHEPEWRDFDDFILDIGLDFFGCNKVI